MLLGRAIDHLPYLVYAVHEMTQRGLGADRSRFALAEVTAVDAAGERQTIYTGETQQFHPPHDASRSLSELIRARIAQLSPRDTLQLRFLTPTRIKVANELQPRAGFELLARNLLRRVSLLAAVH